MQGNINIEKIAQLCYFLLSSSFQFQIGGKMKIKITLLITLTLLMTTQVNILAVEPPHEDRCRQETEVTIQRGDYFLYTICPWFSLMSGLTYSDFNYQDKSVTLTMSAGLNLIKVIMKEECRYSMIVLRRKDCSLIMDMTILKIDPEGKYITLDWSIYPMYLDK